MVIITPIVDKDPASRYIAKKQSCLYALEFYSNRNAFLYGKRNILKVRSTKI